jgi:hypothetical protein
MTAGVFALAAPPVLDLASAIAHPPIASAIAATPAATHAMSVRRFCFV